MLSTSTYQTMDGSFRSPGVTRKCGPEEAATKLAKKSKRSKSSEIGALAKDDPFLRPGRKDNSCMDDPLTALNKRWSIIAKTQESMTKQELLNNYRLLMNDHLRLERFLSIVTKDNEMARNRLETDLLDAMMCIEDLKQALEIRMARRRKIDPRESEERRSLIRQNKKLLNQLYESAKKIENLELTKLEMKEQLELIDFQMVEVENQKAIMEEELRRQPARDNGETQTEEDWDTGPSAIAMAKAETASVLSELANQQAEGAALMAKHRHLENLVRELRRDNSELREQVVRTEEDSENSLAESDKHMQGSALEAELSAKNEHIAQLEQQITKMAHEPFKMALGEHEPSREMAMMRATVLALQAELAERKTNTGLTQQQGTNVGSLSKGDQDMETVVSESEQNQVTAVNGLLTENIENPGETDSQTLQNLHRHIEELTAQNSRLQISLLAAGLKLDSLDDGFSSPEVHSPEFYSSQFAQLQNTNQLDSLKAQLAVSEKRRLDLERRLTDITAEVSRAQSEHRVADTALTASRRTEAALRRRLLATMDTGGAVRGDRNRPVSCSIGYEGLGSASPPSTKEEFEMQTKVIKLEAINVAMVEASQLDKLRLQEQAARIGQLEAEHRALHDRMSSLQASESCAQRAGVRLQALYEDMLREFSEASTQDAHRRRSRQSSDQRGYETDTVLTTTNNNRHSANFDTQLCHSATCNELRKVLSAFQDRFIHTSEQLAETEAKLADLESSKITADTIVTSSTNTTKSPACLQLICALKTVQSSGGVSGKEREVSVRLLNRLERWVVSRLMRSDLIEAQLRQRLFDLQLSLSSSRENVFPKQSDVLSESIQAQRQELVELYQRIDELQDELEVAKAYCESHSIEFTAKNSLIGH